jgi:hypothetical protein
MYWVAHLRERGHDSLFAASLNESQDEDSEALRLRFDDGLAKSLVEGRFRLVIVLDSAPKDPVHLVGYLEFVSDRLFIDLITVAAYEVGETKLVDPTRVEPERPQAEQPLGSAPVGDSGTEYAGIEEFRMTWT